MTSIVTDPNADPHQYESNTADACLFAQANYVILNYVGYAIPGSRNCWMIPNTPNYNHNRL